MGTYDEKNDPYDFDPNEEDSLYLGVGTHKGAEVVDHELGESSTGNPNIAITFKAGSQTHTEYYSLTPKSRWKLAQLFSACGWTSKLQLNNPGMIRKAIYDKPLDIVLESQHYNGKNYTRLSTVKAGTRSEPRDTAGADEKVPF